MGLGILEDKHLEHVPGTANVLDGDRRREVESHVAQREGLRQSTTLQYEGSLVKNNCQE
jgi:hypothetical protein